MADRMLSLLLFLYGLAAGYLLVRTRRSAPRLSDGKLIVPLGWFMLAVSLTLAVALLAWQAWAAFEGQGGAG